MQEKLTLVKRWLGSTPPFWKRLQIICLFLVAIIGQLGFLGLVSKELAQQLSEILGAIAVVAQFAVVDTPVLLEALEHPDSLLQHLPEILGQLKQVKDALKSPGFTVPPPPLKVVKPDDYPDINTNDK